MEHIEEYEMTIEKINREHMRREAEMLTIFAMVALSIITIICIVWWSL